VDARIFWRPRLRFEASPHNCAHACVASPRLLHTAAGTLLAAWHDMKLLAVVLSLAACATAPAPAPISPELARASIRVQLMDGRPLTPHRRIREVQGLSCAREVATDPDRRAARERLRVEAARLGGDVVGNIMCQEEDGAPSHRDCWKIARCTGDAYRPR
jgi:hypothetical protein